MAVPASCTASVSTTSKARPWPSCTWHLLAHLRPVPSLHDVRGPQQLRFVSAYKHLGTHVVEASIHVPRWSSRPGPCGPCSFTARRRGRAPPLLPQGALTPPASPRSVSASASLTPRASPPFTTTAFASPSTTLLLGALGFRPSFFKDVRWLQRVSSDQPPACDPEDVGPWRLAILSPSWNTALAHAKRDVLCVPQRSTDIKPSRHDSLHIPCDECGLTCHSPSTRSTPPTPQDVLILLPRRDREAAPPPRNQGQGKQEVLSCSSRAGHETPWPSAIAGEKLARRERL